MDDMQIIRLYYARDPTAISETDKKYGRLCYAVADGILHCREDNEECVNDTYLAAWNTIPPEKPEHLSAFLCRIARNLSLKKYERRHAKKRNADLDVSLSELEEVLPGGSDTADEIEIRELGAIIRLFLRSLPPPQAPPHMRLHSEVNFFSSERSIVSGIIASNLKICKRGLYFSRQKKSGTGNFSFFPFPDLQNRIVTLYYSSCS